MKRNVCTASLFLRSAGVVLIAFGGVLAIFWPQIFEHILAGVGHDSNNKKRFLLTRLSIIGTRSESTIEDV